MPRRLVPILLLVAAVVSGAVYYARRDSGRGHFTGFVEGEERILRSEVSGRVLEVKFAEGDPVPPDAVVAVLDSRDIEAKVNSKRQEIAAIDAQLNTQQEKIELVQSTWRRDVLARGADVRQAESTVDVAERTYAREQELVKTGASTMQLLDDQRGRRDQARSGLERAREMLARTEAEERTIEVARRELETLRAQRSLSQAQLAELEVTRAKYDIHAPTTTTVVQTQFVWAGELAQPGTAVLAVLDPNDKYVQIYVPVADASNVQVGQKVEIELDSQPGRRIPGEISFVADKANFTPEKIETRSDRMGQVYRAKVRILEGADRLQPGTEGNVYLTGK
jgi:HlyD family secretion protein